MSTHSCVFLPRTCCCGNTLNHIVNMGLLCTSPHFNRPAAKRSRPHPHATARSNLSAVSPLPYGSSFVRTRVSKTTTCFDGSPLRPAHAHTHTLAVRVIAICLVYVANSAHALDRIRIDTLAPSHFVNNIAHRIMLQALLPSQCAVAVRTSRKV